MYYEFYLLQAIKEDKTQENSHIVGTYFLEKLAELREEFEIVGDVRGKGLMIGIEMVTDKVKSFYNYQHTECEKNWCVN